jgi:hypothetical protein
MLCPTLAPKAPRNPTHPAPACAGLDDHGSLTAGGVLLMQHKVPRGNVKVHLHRATRRAAAPQPHQQRHNPHLIRTTHTMPCLLALFPQNIWRAGGCTCAEQTFPRCTDRHLAPQEKLPPAAIKPSLTHVSMSHARSQHNTLCCRKPLQTAFQPTALHHDPDHLIGAVVQGSQSEGSMQQFPAAEVHACPCACTCTCI